MKDVVNKNYLANCNLSAGIIHQRSRSSEQPSANLSTKMLNDQLTTSFLAERLSNKPVNSSIPNKAYIHFKDSIYQPNQQKNMENLEKFTLKTQAVPPLPLKRIAGGENKNLPDRSVLCSRLFNVGFILK